MSTTNPFAAGVHDGMQTYYCTSDDRVRAVSHFDRGQCAAALQLDGLQKTVERAVHARLRHLDQVRMTLHFEDQGQDFLRWELDDKGKVIGCQPFQSGVWRGLHVVNHKALRLGSFVRYVRKGESTSEQRIRYPLIKVEDFGPTDT